MFMYRYFFFLTLWSCSSVPDMFCNWWNIAGSMGKLFLRPCKILLERRTRHLFCSPFVAQTGKFVSPPHPISLSLSLVFFSFLPKPSRSMYIYLSFCLSVYLSFSLKLNQTVPFALIFSLRCQHFEPPYYSFFFFSSFSSSSHFLTPTLLFFFLPSVFIPSQDEIPIFSFFKKPIIFVLFIFFI